MCSLRLAGDLSEKFTLNISPEGENLSSVLFVAPASKNVTESPSGSLRNP